MWLVWEPAVLHKQSARRGAGSSCTTLLLLAVMASPALSVQSTSAVTRQAAESGQISDYAWAVIQYPESREVVVSLLPTSPDAVHFTGVARVSRAGASTQVSVFLAPKMEMLNKKGGDFLGRRVGASEWFRLCDGTQIKIESGRIVHTEEKCPRGSVLVRQPTNTLGDVAALSLYAVDPAGGVTLLGPLPIKEGQSAQTYVTPLDSFMLVLSPRADLSRIDEKSLLAFRSAVPQGFAVVPFRRGDPGPMTAGAPNQPLRLPRPSPKASVTQTVGVTDVTITYSRPGVKGRTIWGDPPTGTPAGTATLDDARARLRDAAIVPYGRVWRAGANEATTFTVTDDVLVNGQPLKAGTYSLHTVPGRDEWTIIFNSDAGQWGSFTYDEKKDVLRIKAKPRATTEAQEWLAFQVDPAGESTAQVQLRWEKVAVPFTVEVQDARAVALRKAREAVVAARPDDWQTPLQAANYLLNNRGDLTHALAWAEQSVKARENFNNLNLKARILAAQGRTAEAIATGEKALQVGRAANANAQALAAFERSLVEWRAKN